MAIIDPLTPSPQSLDPARVVEADTDVGSIWLERDAELMTPAVLEHGFWAPEITALMRAALRPGMTFIDAGANVGYFSVLASKLVGPQGRVFCIEVDPANVEILRGNLWKNDCTNARVLPVAAWDEDTQLALVLNEAGGAGNSVNAAQSGGPTVPAFRLDGLIDGRVDYLKIDCEGSDHRVVNGATGLIRSNPGLLITVEFMAGHAGAALEIYRALKLKPYRIRVDGTLRPTSYRQVARLGAEDEAAVFDFALATKRPSKVIGSPRLPEEWRMRTSPDFQRRLHHALGRAGDLLDHVPERWRPRIRNRDRHPVG
jgi:FkbM family methyltransferase